MNELVPYMTFKWIVTLLTGLIAGTWLVYDFLKIVWLRNADRSNPVVRDKIFGYAIGVCVGAIGVIGCLRFHDVL